MSDGDHTFIVYELQKRLREVGPGPDIKWRFLDAFFDWYKTYRPEFESELSLIGLDFDIRLIGDFNDYPIDQSDFDASRTIESLTELDTDLTQILHFAQFWLPLLFMIPDRGCMACWLDMYTWMNGDEELVYQCMTCFRMENEAGEEYDDDDKGMMLAPISILKRYGKL